MIPWRPAGACTGFCKGFQYYMDYVEDVSEFFH